MKKSLSVLLLVFTLITGLIVSGCSKESPDNKKSEASQNGNETKKEVVLKVGASPVPHSELLNLVKDDLKEQGIILEIKEFNDYVQPNIALNDKQLDANFFQHKPYLDEFIEAKGVDLVSLGQVHVEPLGLYSESIKSLDELKDGATIAIPNDPTNGGRALLLLQNQGLIKLKENAGLTATSNDIDKNPKKLKFEELDAAQIPRTLKDVDAAVINGNFALDAGLVPTKDALTVSKDKKDDLVLEGKESPYANIIAVRKGEENNENLKALLKALQSDKVKKYIEENYKGGVVPAF
ncbi:ABC transporter D-methionine-binding protein MetQ [Gottschalkia purinilytica]|uniref:Lipoprotein n=1 Tax=Gottschalkia purinilytica TaxID=1503 RepID=A0A0L0W6R0_GOTPU|nr:MetQ/NlpA family ABC transporter substrate-binding protein [Gottschalkia purinilytica]KNF07214.1 ABC transporter D-methionine-binding protein MetQ [Gottschalkia purinilytica]